MNSVSQKIRIKLGDKLTILISKQSISLTSNKVLLQVEDEEYRWNTAFQVLYNYLSKQIND